MIKYDNFDNFYSNIDLDEEYTLNKWQELKNKKKKVFRIIVMCLAMLDVIAILVLKKLILIFIMPMLVINIVITATIYMIIGGKDIKQFDKEYKEKNINKLLSNFIDELDYVPLKKMPSSIYDESRYDNDYNIYNSDDYFEGEINGKDIRMADLLVEKQTTTTDSDGKTETQTETVFSGLFGKIDLKKSINSYLVITMGQDSYRWGKQTLEMDSSDFEKNFNVYTDNQIVAMQLLTADIQEDILDLYNKYNIDFHIYINGSLMYILFKTGSMFEVFDLKKSPTQVLEKYFEIMRFIYNITEKITKTVDETQI